MIELLSGKNHYQLSRALSARKQKYAADSIEVIDASQAEWNEINQATMGMSLFADEDRLIVIHNIEHNKTVADQLTAHVEQIPSSTYVLLVSPGVDKRSALYKKVKREGLVEEFTELEAPKLVNWVRKTVDDDGGEIDPSAARFLVERVGEKQQMIAMEINKLLSYNSTITKESIELLVAPTLQDSIFELLDAMTAGKHKRALEIYSRLRQAQVQPVYVVVMLGWQLHSLLAVALAGNKGDREIASDVKLSPFVLGRARALYRRLDKATVFEMIELVAEADVRMKTKSVDTDALLEVLITKLAVLCQK